MRRLAGRRAGAAGRELVGWEAAREPCDGWPPGAHQPTSCSTVGWGVSGGGRENLKEAATPHPCTQTLQRTVAFNANKQGC